MGVLSADQVARLGLAAVGAQVAISDRCSLYGADCISLGDHVRIDDFAVITAREPVVIGAYAHVSAFAFLGGQFGIVLDDFCNVSVRATLLSGSDDFSGEWLLGAQVPDHLSNVHRGRIRLGRHAQVGAHSVVLPGVTLGEGAAVGALSLVKESLAPWSLYAGIPATLIRSRSRRAEELARRLERGET
jgi:galactoside O-acetyltransferase